MKKLIIIATLVCFAAITYGQYEDALPIKSTSASTDTVRVVKDGESSLMLKSVLLANVNANLAAHEADGTNPHLVTAGQVGLGNVENIALSTWPGSFYITSLGTIVSGVWNGDPLTNGYIPTDLVGKTYNGVDLDATGAATEYLNRAGGYSVPPGVASGDSVWDIATAGTLLLYDGGGSNTGITTGDTDEISLFTSGGTEVIIDGNGIISSGNVTAEGELFVEGLTSLVTANGLYYNTSTGRVTYGTASGGGGVGSTGTIAQYDIPYWNDAGTTLAAKSGQYYITDNSTTEQSINIMAASRATGINISQDGSNVHFLGTDSNDEDIFEVHAAGDLSLYGSGDIVMPSLSAGTTTEQLYYNSTTGAITQGAATTGYTGANAVTLNSTIFELGGNMNRNTNVFTNGFDIRIGTANTDGFFVNGGTGDATMQRVSSDGYVQSIITTSLTNGRYEASMVSDDYYYSNDYTKFAVRSDSIFGSFGYANTDHQFILTETTFKASMVPSGTTSDVLYYDPTTDMITYGSAPSGGGGDSIQGSTIYNVRADTVEQVSFAFTDSAQFIVTRKYMLKRATKDIYATKVSVQVPTGTPNFAYNIYHAADGSATGTKLFTSDAVVTGTDATSTGEEDVPDSPSISEDDWIWIQFSDLTAKPPTGAAFTIEGYEE